MPRQSPYPELDALQERMSELPHLKQNVVMTYAILGGLEHSVEHTAAELARRIGVPAPHFSRARRELVADGWLEYTHHEGQVKFFRLGEKATGREVVVPLRSRPTA
ncbi:MarR family transcriptional regulator [Streptomyces sp. NPDC059008]|uniref:MarR family transcriptional regulator n=1 Tax=Streptomyces sp. NPDC059008 TaxID=3346693 RepID=UPI0036AF4FED